MKFTSILSILFIQILSVVFAVEVEFSQSDGFKEVTVEKNSELTVSLKGNQSTGYSWYLENVDGIENTIVEPLNLNEYNSGEYVQKKQGKIPLMGASGTFVFKFKIKEQGELPQLVFIYKRAWEEDVLYTATLDVIVNGYEPEEITLDNSDVAASFSQEGGVIELDVAQGKTVSVDLEGNPTTGYSWILENADELKGVKLVDEEYVQYPTEEGMVGVGGTYYFTFQVTDINEVSSLKFAYQRPWETEAINTAEVILNVVATSSAAAETPVDNETNETEADYEDLVLFSQDGGIKDLEVRPNEEILVTLEGNPTTGYSWTLKNADELKGVKLVEEEYVQNPAEEGMVGVGGKFHFTFQVTDINELSSIKFAYQRPWETDGISEAELVLKSQAASSADAETPIIDEVDTPAPLEEDADEDVVGFFTENGGVIELEVEQGKTFSVDLEGNPTTGYSWSLENADELKGVEQVGYEYIQGGEEGLDGVGGTFEYQFQVVEAGELSTLKFAYKRPWETEAINTAEVILKVKGAVAAENPIAVETQEAAETPVDAVIEQDEEEEVASNEITVSFGQNGGNESIAVKDGQLFNVRLQGNPSTGYRWTLQNASDLKGIVKLNEEYVQNPAKKGLLGAGGTFVYKFQVKNANELSTLKFEYKRGSNAPRSTAEVVISKEGGEVVAYAAPVEEVNKVTFNQNDTHGEVSVKSNSTFTIRIKGNPTTGFSWTLNNAKELEKAGITIIINGNYTASSPRLIGGGGVYEYKFQVGDVNENLPSIKFTYKRSWISIGGQQLVVDLKPANQISNINQ